MATLHAVPRQENDASPPAGHSNPENPSRTVEPNMMFEPPEWHARVAAYNNKRLLAYKSKSVQAMEAAKTLTRATESCGSTRRRETILHKFTGHGVIDINLLAAEELAHLFDDLQELDKQQVQEATPIKREHETTHVKNPLDSEKQLVSLEEHQDSWMLPYYTDDNRYWLAKQHTFLHNDTGAAKTTSYLSAIVLHLRQLEKWKQNGEDVRFSPSLILTSPDRIHEIYDEIEEHFPDLKVKIHRGGKAGFVNNIAPDPLSPLLREWAEKDNEPDTGKAVILSTFHEWGFNFVGEIKRPFVFKPEKGPVPKNAEPDGNLVERILDHGALGDTTFGFVIWDEGHDGELVSSYRTLLRLFEWNTLLWVSSTPAQTSFEDLLSPLNAMWWSYGIDWTPAISSVGWLLGLYSDLYDPYQENSLFEQGITHGIFTDKYLSEYPDVRALKVIFDESGSKLWMVNPTLFKAVGLELDWGPDLGHLVIHPIYRAMQTCGDGVVPHCGID
ncbi:hypothetical protein ACHAPT_001238 [Fusarium lateritium]